MTPNAYCYINKDWAKDPNERLWPGIDVKAGLERAGFNNRCKYANVAKVEVIYPWDLLVAWTLWRRTQRRTCADGHIKLGGTVLCMENGFLPMVNGVRHYQLAKRVGYGSGINGQGETTVGGPERWRSWGIRMEPWRTEGRHILVCAQRGVREEDPDITHGAKWPDDVVARLREYTDRPIHFRPHPGNKRPCLPKKGYVDKVIDPSSESLAENLKGAWAAVVYTSTAANECIIRGVPVCYDGPAILCKNIAGRVKQIENPPIMDREAEFEKLAWYQWSHNELRSGEAFRHVLGIV